VTGTGQAGGRGGPEAVRVGLVGAGPWAAGLYCPALRTSPATTLAGIWARREEAAGALAAEHGSRAFGDLDALFDSCEAVAFAVPPDVQAELAMRAVRAGRAVLLEKPLALDVEAARRLADAVASAGVASMVTLTYRFNPAVQDFLARASGAALDGGRAVFASDAFLGGQFSTPWRLEHGALADVGPHVVDLLDAALGRVVGVRAHASPGRWYGLLLDHESGAVSEASLTATVAAVPPVFRAEVYGREHALAVDANHGMGPAVHRAVVEEFAGLVSSSTADHPLSAGRGLFLAEVVDRAYRDLR